jgi:hypothetical protein
MSSGDPHARDTPDPGGGREGEHPIRVMLDPTLFLAPTWLERTLTRAEVLSHGDPPIELYLPAGFIRSCQDPSAYARVLSFYGPPRGGITDPSRVAKALSGIEAIPFERPTTGTDGEYAELILGRLEPVAEDPLVADILAEQWAFLMQRSLIAARIKRTFKALAEAGTVAIEYMGHSILDPTVRRTLDLERDRTLDAVQRLRALAKWIAAGPGEISSVLLPPGIAQAAQVGFGLFVLIDPPSTPQESRGS